MEVSHALHVFTVVLLLCCPYMVLRLLLLFLFICCRCLPCVCTWSWLLMLPSVRSLADLFAFVDAVLLKW